MSSYRPLQPPPHTLHTCTDVRKAQKEEQMLTQYESTPEFSNASGSGRCGDDEMADDEDGSEDEEDEEDGDS
ncbi:hypothetical protein Tco_1475589 [Tanacetum coccineum]